MATPLSWLERVPTYKGQIAELGEAIETYGFLGYPLLQTADIILYKATKVPVGQDQLLHLELAREVVRRMNHLYGPVFPEPQALLAEFPLVLGPDNRKMSKSYGNALTLGMGDEIDRMVMSMITDLQRVRRDIPGRPEVCNVFTWHRLLDAPRRRSTRLPRLHHRRARLRRGQARPRGPRAGDDRPIRERRAALLAEPERIDAILEEGAERAWPSPRPSSPRSRRRWGCEAVVTVGDLAVIVVTRALGPGAGAYDRQVAQDAEPSLEAGRAALEAGEWSAAKSAFETAVERARREALLGLGEAVWWLGDVAESVRYRESAYAEFRRGNDPAQAAAVAVRLSLTYRANLGNRAAAAGWLRARRVWSTSSSSRHSPAGSR